MKTTFSLLMLLMLVACKNPEQAALVAVTVTNISADTAAGAYLDFKEYNTVSAATHAKIVHAARVYRDAKNVARVAVLAWKDSSTVENKAKADIAKSAMANAAASLISLIREFNPSLITQNEPRSNRIARPGAR